MSLKKKWIDLLYKVAIGSKVVRTILTPIGAAVYILFTTLFVVLSLQVDRLLKFPKLLYPPMNNLLAPLVIVTGSLILLWTGLFFIRSKGTPVPVNPPPGLVKSGPYAYCRNPMLSGVFILLFGLGIHFGSISLICIFTPFFILINVLELKSIEEPELIKRLGSDYLDYKKNTPMFIPKLRKRNKY